MSAFSYLALNSGNDPIFADGSSLTGATAVAQAVQTRLNLFFGEWWENLTLGLPVFQSILGQLGSPQGLSAMQLLITQTILKTPYVTSASPVAVKFTGGVLQYSATVYTAFGPTAINAVLLGG